jgi:adenosylhomocysteine nucleosidase
MAILYVASESSELKPFADLLTGLRKLKWPIDYAFEGIWEGRRIMLAANGAGRKLAERAVEVAIRAVTAAELSSSKLDAIVSTGYCGALDPSLRECRIVVATQVVDLARNESFPCAPVMTDNGECAFGVVVSQDRIACDVAEKTGLSAHGIAVDMEAAAVAARAKRAGLPFSCIKVVSDRLDESFGVDLNEMRTTEGRIARGKISLYAITHPKLIPELLRLRRRTSDASKFLGDFLVSCRISSEPDGVHPE